jgi:hypothetical protein
VAGVQFLAGQEIFLCSAASRPALGPTQPLIQWVLEALSLGIMLPAREDDRLPPPSAEVKNGGAISPLPHKCLHGVVLN